MPRGVRNPKPEDVNNVGADIDAVANLQDGDITSNVAEDDSTSEYHKDCINMYQRPDLRSTSWRIRGHYRETGERCGKFIAIVCIAPGFNCRSGWIYRP